MDYLECDQAYVYEWFAHNDKAISRCDLVNTRFDSRRLEFGLFLPLSKFVLLHPNKVTLIDCVWQCAEENVWIQEGRISKKQWKIVIRRFLIFKGKVFPMTCLCGHRGEAEYSFNPFATSALEAGRWSTSHPGRFTPGEDAVPIVQETGWCSEPISTARRISPTPGFNPRTFQPVASRYTFYAIPDAS
jgi:hypothetical protein